mmetsp:Transcript_10008/g.14978  ORF Transcript_10008/g.14978 Transcript_10008/m.14978 type:complete len:115 (-) Transcript_10008:1188-1532(-)
MATDTTDSYFAKRDLDADLSMRVVGRGENESQPLRTAMSVGSCVRNSLNQQLEIVKTTVVEVPAAAFDGFAVAENVGTSPTGNAVAVAVDWKLLEGMSERIDHESWTTIETEEN